MVTSLPWVPVKVKVSVSPETSMAPDKVSPDVIVPPPVSGIGVGVGVLVGVGVAVGVGVGVNVGLGVAVVVASKSEPSEIDTSIQSSSIYAGQLLRTL
jgi:hypothetical protein